MNMIFTLGAADDLLVWSGGCCGLSGVQQDWIPRTLDCLNAVGES